MSTANFTLCNFEQLAKSRLTTTLDHLIDSIYFFLSFFFFVFVFHHFDLIYLFKKKKKKKLWNFSIVSNLQKNSMIAYMD